MPSGITSGEQTAPSPPAPDFLLHHSQWLPSDRLQRCANRASGGRAIAADGASMKEALGRLESSTSSRTAAIQATSEFGVSATIHSLVMAALSSLSRNETLFSPALTLWSNPARCAASDLSCFFSSLPSVAKAASATADFAGISPRLWQAFSEIWQGRKSAFASSVRDGLGANASLLSLHSAMHPRLQASRHRTSALCRRQAIKRCPRLVPVHFAATADEELLLSKLPERWTRHGRFWVISQALRFLTRPNAQLLHALRRARADLRFTEHQPVLALHVRKGDACRHRGECKGLAAFMPHVYRMVHQLGYRSVFLSTPSPEVITEIALFPNITWLHRKRNFALQDALNSHGLRRLEDALLKRGLIDPVQEWQDAMLDVYLMAESEGLVAAFSSNAARLAYSLMTARAGGCIKPFISVDINWCFAFMRGGVNVIRRDSEPAKMAVGSAGSLTC
ncbi:MAG: hypothetical protein SGPRY_005330 [Prymnesium sp.]